MSSNNYRLVEQLLQEIKAVGLLQVFKDKKLDDDAILLVNDGLLAVLCPDDFGAMARLRQSIDAYVKQQKKATTTANDDTASSQSSQSSQSLQSLQSLQRSTIERSGDQAETETEPPIVSNDEASSGRVKDKADVQQVSNQIEISDVYNLESTLKIRDYYYDCKDDYYGQRIPFFNHEDDSVEDFFNYWRKYRKCMFA